jgi:hypothetical protein
MAALPVLLLTGLVLIVGEPERELMSWVFWTKMAMLALVMALCGDRVGKRAGGAGARLRPAGVVCACWRWPRWRCGLPLSAAAV